MAVQTMTRPRPSRLQKMWKSVSIVFDSRVATVGMAIVTFWVILAFISLFWTPYNPNASDFVQNQGPSAQNWLGTDHLGRDIFSRLMQGTQVILLKTRLPGDAGVSIPGGVAIWGVLGSLTLGAVLGLNAGYRGGWWDQIIMQVLDALIAFSNRSISGRDCCSGAGGSGGHPGNNHYRGTRRSSPGAQPGAGYQNPRLYPGSGNPW